MKRIVPLILATLSTLAQPLPAHAAGAGDLEFLEAFVWGDRAAALKELVPDTEDYFTFHGLHYQLSGDQEAFERNFERWLAVNRGSRNERMRELQRRQMLLGFERAPAATWKFLRDDLRLTFQHTPRHEQRAARHPSALTPEQYGVDAFLGQARSGGSLVDELTGRGLELVGGSTPSPALRRALLGRLERPDVPGLVEMILADFDTRDSLGFGHHEIHRRLTRAQLEELGRRRPTLLRSAAYVVERLARLPAPDADLAEDHAAAVAYYRDLWEFVRTLEAMHNPLKGSVLYRLLDHQRRLGVYDAELFRTYVELPRSVPYLPRERHTRLQQQGAAWVDFQYRPGRDLALPPIGDEEPLVREYLIELLRAAPDPSGYAEVFESRWLDAIFAESKILGGVGRPEDWAPRLAPDAYRAILERVELNFAPQNPSSVRAGQPVELAVDLKRVDGLVVKIFEIQTFNYYTTRRAAVDQAVDLDGMVATHERRLETRADPGRRVRHRIPLPEIAHRGVYVVELIGNGVSSRALLHVGRLEAVSLPTPAGQAVLVIDDAGETAKRPAIWIDGREFAGDERGLVLLPFSEAPGVRFAVLRDGDFCSPERIRHLGEEYSFSAGIHLDPQNLPRRTTGTLMLRPDLRIHGVPLDPALLGSVKVTLAAIDARGVRTEREYAADFVRNAEWTGPFYVPDALRRLEVRVEARLARTRDREKITLSDARAIEVNAARAGDTLQEIFLVPAAGGWALEVRGLNGEPIEGVPLSVGLQHPGFARKLGDLPTSTDARGRVALGPLTALSAIAVRGPGGLRLERQLSDAAAVLPARLHLSPGEAVSLPYPYDRAPDLRALSLFQVKGGTILADFADQATVRDGELRIEGLPVGEYALSLHESGQAVVLEVAEGPARGGFILGRTRRLQQTGNRLPSVSGVESGGGEAVVRLRNVTPSTRVAVRAFRFLDEGSMFPAGGGFPAPSQRSVLPPHVQYLSGRAIGDEYRYVLERRTRGEFAGTLLERPGLILNPWSLRETTAEQERLKRDQAYRGGRQELSAPAEARMQAAPSSPAAPLPGGGQAPSIGYDFLSRGSRWWVNLVPAADGSVVVPLKELGEHTALEIIVLDRFGLSRSRHRLEDKGFEPREVRLLSGLKVDGSFSRQKSVRVAGAGEVVVLPDLATSRYQTIRTVGQAFDLLQSLGGGAALAEFAFLKEWPKLDEAAKLKKYGEFASHELHLFLHERDRAFFDKVVRPYLGDKKDKTFVDRWLLGALAPEDTRLDRLQDRNALELALLARRGGDAQVARAALREAWELLPPDPEGFARRVRAALQSSELDEALSLARDTAKERAGAASPMMQRAAATAPHYAQGAAPAPAAVAPPAKLAGEEKRPTKQVLAARGEEIPVKDWSFSMAEEEVGGGRESDDALQRVMDGAAAARAAREDRLYRALPKTREWAEQNYYKLPAREDEPGRIPVNGFWIDVAAGAAVPERLLEAHRTLTEIVAALAFSGLPFEAVAPRETVEGAQLAVTVKSPALLVTEQILAAKDAADDRPLLLSQQIFRPDDPYRYEGNEQVEKFVTGELVRRVAYGARVTLTNPTASRRRLNVLVQIPFGAIPLRNGSATDDVAVMLDAYTTRTVEYFFAFPFAGEFPQFPAHVSADGAIVGRAAPRVFTVVDAPTEVDKTSWAWISQHASAEETLAFLRGQNLRRVDLGEMAWRLKDRAFFERAADLLAARGLFHDATFSYSLFHQDIERARVWLGRRWGREGVGPVLESPLLTVDPVAAKTYEHLEYDPLVNPRVHPVGERRKILNAALDAQYRAFLRNGLYRPGLSAKERLALVYYLLLQDRLAEAADELAKVRDADLDEQVQTDYLRAWLALRTLDVDLAQALVQPRLAHPVPRWNARFAAIAQAVKEARGAEVAAVEEPSRQQELDRQAAQAPSLELKVEAGKLLVAAQNLTRVTLNLYPVDIELMFSRKPFLAEGGADFAVIKPAYSRETAVRGKGEPEELTLPREFAGRNLMVEVAGQGLRASAAWYANRLRVRKMESFGQVEVRSAKSGAPLPKTYVKVFARGSDGAVSFWKDGYTDLRGRFDYLSLNDRQPEEAVELAILILHPELGAEIRTAAPPTR